MAARNASDAEGDSPASNGSGLPRARSRRAFSRLTCDFSGWTSGSLVDARVDELKAELKLDKGEGETTGAVPTMAPRKGAPYPRRRPVKGRPYIRRPYGVVVFFRSSVAITFRIFA
jgi:hypothetical protein